MQVRQTRLKMMGENNQTSYDDINHIKFEISQARLILQNMRGHLLMFQEGQLKKHLLQ